MQQIFGEGQFILFDILLNICSATYLKACVCCAGEHGCGMQLYADLFKENHITGKRLLLLTENDMRDMGVKSKGHVIHLKARRS